jgi:hypothetical protein
MKPNFTVLDCARPEVAKLILAMLRACGASNSALGPIRNSPPAKNGGPTCLRTLALASESAAVIYQSSKRSIG